MESAVLEEHPPETPSKMKLSSSAAPNKRVSVASFLKSRLSISVRGRNRGTVVGFNSPGGSLRGGTIEHMQKEARVQSGDVDLKSTRTKGVMESANGERCGYYLRLNI